MVKKDKKEFVKALMAGMMITVSLTGCGDAEEKVIKGEEIAESGISMENSDTAEEDGSIDVSDEAAVSEPEEEITYTEKGDVYLMDNVYNEGEQIDLSSFEFDSKQYTLIKRVDIYYTDGTLAGYTKDEAPVYVISSNDEWSFCSFDTNGYLIKKEELMNSVLVEKEKEEVAVAKTEEQHVIYFDATGKANAEEPVNTKVAEETPAVKESTKYTPEEAVEVYRSIMEANGISWNPSLKDGGSWGTGFFLLEKGWIDENAYSSVESFKMGDSVGNPYTDFYVEITGSDENAVYITEWAD